MLAEDTGTLLYGGYDSERVGGDFIPLQVQPDYNGNYREIVVAWTFVGLNDGSGTYSVFEQNNTPVVFDTGSTSMEFPPNAYNTLLTQLGFQMLLGSPVIDCDALKKSTYTLDFGFGGFTNSFIRVPLRYFANEIINDDGSASRDGAGTALCSPAFLAGEPGTPLVFGDTLLKAAYTIFDLENRMVYMAPIRYSDKSNVIALDTGAKIQGVQDASNQVEVHYTAGAPGRGQQIAGVNTQTATRFDVTVTGSGPKATGTLITEVHKTKSVSTSTSQGRAAAATGAVDMNKVLFAGAVAAAGMAAAM